MPLFSSSTKKAAKKAAPRKAQVSSVTRELDPDKISDVFNLDIGPINLRLGDQEARFEKGDWIPESGPVSGTHKENIQLKQQVHQLEEENNLLRLKVDMLLTLLTETTADAHMQEKEILQLRKQIS